MIQRKRFIARIERLKKLLDEMLKARIGANAPQPKEE